MSTSKPVIVYGASGYTGEELVRVLARHPRVRLAAVCSRSLAGKAVAEELPRLVAPLRDGEADAAVCAMENSIEGSVSIETMDLLINPSFELRISGEVVDRKSVV